MACNYILNSSFIPSFPRYPHPKFKKPRILILISCCRAKYPEKDRESGQELGVSRVGRNSLNFLQLVVTLTVVSNSLPRPASAAANVSQKRRLGKKHEALRPEELKKWTQGLRVVSHRLPYSEILDLERDNNLKHVIKPPNVGLKPRPEVVLAVLEDNKVLRIVLPSVESDYKFWVKWDKLEIDGLCMNAHSPEVKTPEIPKPYFGVLSEVPKWMFSLVKQKPQSKKALELKRMREEIKQRKNEELAKVREDREITEKAMNMQKKMEEKEKRRDRLASESSQDMAMMWDRLASDSNVATGLGIVFFYIFYRAVVLDYRKQKRDYEDRLKIEKAEAEEKRMMELGREVAGIEDGDDEEGGEKGEDNPYMKVARQFMRSGARVRQAQNRKLPRYLERGVDVKFTDVAGLGKIRLELEEIVKFFTHVEMYRRHGAKIPGSICCFHR